MMRAMSMSDHDEAFPGIGKIKFEGPDSKDPLSFKHYDANQEVVARR